MTAEWPMKTAKSPSDWEGLKMNLKIHQIQQKVLRSDQD
jgi:hypothetical protein